MNPIYRHKLVNTFLSNGAIMQTGEIETAIDYYFTYSFIDISDVYPRKLYQSYTPLSGGCFYDINKKLIGGWSSNPAAYNTEFDIPTGAYYIRFNVLKSQYRNGTAYLKVGSIDSDNILDGIIVNPIYKDDLSKEYELETSQQFYRAKLSGKISFIREDFDFINSKPFDYEFLYLIEKSDDCGATWYNYYQGKFTKTDCTFNEDDRKVTVQPDTVDEYNDVLAGLEKEYNLIELLPEINRVTIYKRPLLQIYVPGESVISCFLSGMFLEQDVVSPTTDINALINTYRFSSVGKYAEIALTAQSGAPSKYNGIYIGKIEKGDGTNTLFVGDFYCNGKKSYIHYEKTTGSPNGQEIYEFQDVDTKDFYTYVGYNNISTKTVVLSPVPVDESKGILKLDIVYTEAVARYLCDVEKIDNVNTYPLPSDDLVGDNRNYRRVTGYDFDVIYMYDKFSQSPTEWGLADNGLYFEQPNILSQVFYPIARSRWGNFSLWYNESVFDVILEENARKAYTLRDAYPISSCIDVLLKKIAPGITHKPTEEYSKFLYSSLNPISGQKFKLLACQKTNIIKGEYQTPAQKAMTTLQQFTNMLRDCFQCYWYIENGKFKIEHIKFFKNGGSYNDTPNISHDLTSEINVRNGKAWAFATSEYSFDKFDLPERYQFKWMDDVNVPFNGLPIEIVSRYVTQGKIEEINVSNFTSDIDMMLLNPESISEEGFALLAAVLMDGKTQYELPIIQQEIDGKDYTMQNGYVAFSMLQRWYWLNNLPAKKAVINGVVTNALGIERKKKQTLSFPALTDPNPMNLIKTYLGICQVEKLSINLQSRLVKATLKYDTE